MRHSASVYFLPWQFMVIRLAHFKSSFWSSRPPNGMRFFINRRETSPLQPYFHEIRYLHPNFFMEVPNILSLISHHSIFRCGADQVGTFEWINMELKNSNWVRMYLNESCSPPLPDSGGLKRWWHQNCFDKTSKVDNSVSPDNATILQKMILFLCVHIQSLLNGSLSRLVLGSEFFIFLCLIYVLALISSLLWLYR